MNLKNISRALFALTLVLVLAGCSGLWSLKPPTVSIAQIKLGKSTLFEQNFVVQLKVDNPNERELVLNGLEFDLELEGLNVGHGRTSTANTLPSLGSTTVAVDFKANLLKLLADQKSLLAITQNNQIHYRIQGHAVTEDFGNIPFDKTGVSGLAQK